MACLYSKKYVTENHINVRAYIDLVTDPDSGASDILKTFIIERSIEGTPDKRKTEQFFSYGNDKWQGYQLIKGVTIVTYPPEQAKRFALEIGLDSIAVQLVKDYEEAQDGSDETKADK